LISDKLKEEHKFDDDELKKIGSLMDIEGSLTPHELVTIKEIDIKIIEGFQPTRNLLNNKKTVNSSSSVKTLPSESEFAQLFGQFLNQMIISK
jgi:phosphohistidine swiveling domain-containing protein